MNTTYLRPRERKKKKKPPHKNQPTNKTRNPTPTFQYLNGDPEAEFTFSPTNASPLSLLTERRKSNSGRAANQMCS